ncbi:MAG: prepilin peptidase [Pirellulaceae bacterium]
MNELPARPKKRRRRRKPNWPLWSLIAALIAICCGYVLASITPYLGDDYRFNDLLPPRLLDLFVAVWFFWFGSSIGSFLNVVAWRVPRGRSINGHSGCPFCGTPIRFQDNVPVFGWMKLRGRCRACRLPIAARYPIVEVSVGLTVMLVGLFGVYTGGENLPFATPKLLSDSPLRMPVISGEDIAINVYHLLMLSSLWALALIRFDGFRLPPKLVRFILIAAAVPVVAWPKLQQVPWQMATLPGWNNQSHLVAFFYVITGIAAAVLLARIIGRYACPTADPKLDPLGKETARLIDLIVLLLIPGIVLGWHALIAISVVSIVAAGILRRLFIGRDGFHWFIVSLPVMMSLHLAAWRTLSQWTAWPAPNHRPVVFIAWLAAALILSVDLKATAAPNRDPQIE